METAALRSAYQRTLPPVGSVSLEFTCVESIIVVKEIKYKINSTIVSFPFLRNLPSATMLWCAQCASYIPARNNSPSLHKKGGCVSRVTAISGLQPKRSLSFQHARSVHSTLTDKYTHRASPLSFYAIAWSRVELKRRRLLFLLTVKSHNKNNVFRTW